MLTLLILVIFGLGMAFFATQNTLPIAITIANYTFVGVPLYGIVIGSMILGIFVSWLVNMVDAISSTLTIHGKNSALRQAHEELDTLKQEKHKLEIENAHLRGKPQQFLAEDEEEERKQHSRPSFFHRLRHSLG